MPGFNIALGVHHFPFFYSDDYRLSCNSISSEEYSLQKFTLKKFENDKLFLDLESYVIVLEGVILNKKDFISQGKSWEETVIYLYEKNGELFFSEFRGSFSGALYDKKKRKWIIFTDHIGSKHIYYTRRGNENYFSSEIADLYNLFKESGLNYSLDEQAAYMLLSYGYMLEDYTLCNEIKKLKPGSFIKIEDGKFSLNEYYRLPEAYDETITEDQAIEKLDELFRNSISLQFEKDKEYGYKHFVALSGGLDSRMTSWVAHELGYTDQLNFTFSQSGYLDETIAKQIASDLQHEWIFKALDNGIFLKDIDEINNISGGNALYFGLAHGNSMIKYINFDKLGILHSGQLGDVIIGSYGVDKNEYISKPNSKKLFSKVQNTHADFKLFFETRCLYERGFNGINTGLLPSQLNTETISPFYDISVLDYCLSIPIEIRLNHRLYKKWILKKHPGAADYIWENTKGKLTDIQFEVLGRNFTAKQFTQILFYKIGLKKSATETSFHMNPLDYWYNTNPKLKKFQDDYFNVNIKNLNDFSILKNDCIDLYEKGNNIEKNQVLTLLSALKLFF